jgi:hypothetical protein
VPQIEVSEQQIVEALCRLSPKGRREAVRRLIAGASVLDHVTAFAIGRARWALAED